jgi:hypothetical protein
MSPAKEREPPLVAGIHAVPEYVGSYWQSLAQLGSHWRATRCGDLEFTDATLSARG